MEISNEIDKLKKRFRTETLKLRELKKERDACSLAGYLQHYPEYQKFIHEEVSVLNSIARRIKRLQRKWQ